MGVITDALYYSEERDAQKRIHQLEAQCATLAAEVDAQRPIVEAAIKWNQTNYRDRQEIDLALDLLGEACDDYEAGRGTG